MRISKRSGPSLALLRVPVGVVCISILFLGMAAAAPRLSAGYVMSIDVLSSGGGTSASATYREVDSAIGQEVVCGLDTGSSYVNQAGVIQPWIVNHSQAADWQFYH